MTEHDRIMELESYQMPAAQFRAFLESVKERWYVETRPFSDGLVQGGTVTEVMRDKFGIPVCIRVKSGDGCGDLISVERISFFEADGYFDADYSEYQDFDKTREWVLNQGYVYDEDDCVYRHPDTGEEICW